MVRWLSLGLVAGLVVAEASLLAVGGEQGRVSRAGPGKEPVEIGSRLELFVDGAMIETLAGDARRVLHHPTVREVALAFDAPWEGRDSTYVTVMKDGDRVRLYYRGVGNRNLPEVTCYAVSPDGITFARPKLGLFEAAGTKANNVCWTGPGTHNFAPFKDRNPHARPAERYKALAGGPLWALGSPDGIHWKKLADHPVITKGAFDSQNLAFFDELRGQYVAFFRDFARGVRTVKTCRSKDFITWTEPEWCDYGKAPPEHLYTNATVPYFRAPHIYLSFPKRFMETRTKDPKHPDHGISDGLLMSSRDGLHWERWEEAFLRPGLDPKNWTDRNMMIAWGLVPSSPEEISLYWTEHYSFDTCRLRRGTIRTDGFVSVYAGMSGGELVTRPLRFTGNRLVVNYSSSAAGSLRFQLEDQAGKPFPGFEMAASEVLFGDEIAHEVKWRKGSDLAALAGKPVRLRVSLQDADLYSFVFARR